MRGLSPCLGRALGIAALSGSLGLASLGIAGCRTEVVVEERHRPPPHH
ncbi:hypothetical protein HY251_03540 [bacterium]|nr:hypothetical protein [bacterium]